MTHQELFDEWYQAKRTIVHEFSNDIAAGMRHLHGRAFEYAAANRLIFTVPIEDWWKED